MIEDGEVDAVHVAAPDRWHVPPAVAAIKAGKPVYVENPLGRNVL